MQMNNRKMSFGTHVLLHLDKFMYPDEQKRFFANACVDRQGALLTLLGCVWLVMDAAGIAGFCVSTEPFGDKDVDSIIGREEPVGLRNFAKKMQQKTHKAARELIVDKKFIRSDLGVEELLAFLEQSTSDASVSQRVAQGFQMLNNQPTAQVPCLFLRDDWGMEMLPKPGRTEGCFERPV